MPEGIKVSYATIHAAADDCQTTGGELQQAFDQLKDDLKPLIATWSGSAKDQYDQAQRTWDQKFEDLKQVLAQIAAALPQIADGYQSTDSAVEGLLQLATGAVAVLGGRVDGGVIDDNAGAIRHDVLLLC